MDDDGTGSLFYSKNELRAHQWGKATHRMANRMPTRNHCYPARIFAFNPTIGIWGTPPIFICTLSHRRSDNLTQLLTYVVEYVLFKIRSGNLGGHAVTDHRFLSLPPRYMKDERSVILVDSEVRSISKPLGDRLRPGIDGRSALTIGSIDRFSEVKTVKIG